MRRRGVNIRFLDVFIGLLIIVVCEQQLKTDETAWACDHEVGQTTNSRGTCWPTNGARCGVPSLIPGGARPRPSNTRATLGSSQHPHTVAVFTRTSLPYGITFS